jgi:hypothetical protein
MTERILPRDFPTAPDYIVPLSNAELQELGTFSVIWSQVDWLMMLMIGNMLGLDIAKAITVMESMTTGPRIGLLTKLCLQDIENPVKRAIKKVCDDNGGLIEDRNHIIHGLWAIHCDAKMQNPKAASLYQKRNRKPIFAEKLPILSNRAAEFSRLLSEKLEELDPSFRQIAPRPRSFYFGEDSPEDNAPPPWPPTPAR